MDVSYTFLVTVQCLASEFETGRGILRHRVRIAYCQMIQVLVEKVNLAPMSRIGGFDVTILMWPSALQSDHHY